MGMAVSERKKRDGGAKYVPCINEPPSTTTTTTRQEQQGEDSGRYHPRRAKVGQQEGLWEQKNKTLKTGCAQ